MIENPYESPRGTSDEPVEPRFSLVRRIRRFLIIAAALATLYFIYDTLTSQLFILARPQAIRDLERELQK